MMAGLGPVLYPQAGDLGDLAVTLDAEDASTYERWRRSRRRPCW